MDGWILLRRLVLLEHLAVLTNLGTGPTDRGLRERWLVLLSHLRSSPVQTNKLTKEDILRRSWMKLQIKFTFHIHLILRT